MLLEEFENVPAVIEPTDRSLISGGEICDTIINTYPKSHDMSGYF